MLFKKIRSLVFFFTLSVYAITSFACGSGITQAPCPKPQIALQQNINAMQAVVAIQQQGLRNLLTTRLNTQTGLPVEDTFTTSSVSPNQYVGDSVVASTNQSSSNPQKINLLFTGETIAYSINQELYKSLLKDKKIMSIGSQFVAIPHDQVNKIKSQTIGDAKLSNLQMVVVGSQIEFISND